MQLTIPRSSSASRVIVSLPTGDVKYDSIAPFDPDFDIVLPEGVCEDDIEVSFCMLGNNGQPSTEPVILKARVEAPADDQDQDYEPLTDEDQHASETRLPEIEEDPAEGDDSEDETEAQA